MNKTKILIIFILFACNSVLYAQQEKYSEYYQKISEGMTLSAQKDYNSAVKKYEHAFSLAFPFPDDIIDALKIYSQLQRKEEINKLIDLLILSGYKRKQETAVYIEENESPITYISYSKNSYFPLNDYRLALDSIYEQSRAKRIENIDPSKEKYLLVFSQYEYLITYIRKSKTDPTNINYNSILHNNLWRTTKDFFLNLYYSNQDIQRIHTDSWNDDLFINCLIHSAQIVDYRKEEYQKFLFDMVKKGNLHPYQYAVIIDDVETRLGNNQTFGTKTDPIEFNGDIEKHRNTQKKISLIKKIDEVDKRRFEIFLPPLWVSAKKHNYVLPDDYRK